MAETWRATSQAVAYASGKYLLDLAQDSSGTKVHRVYRAYHFNNGTTAVAGVLFAMRIVCPTWATLTAAPTGGATTTPVAHDTDNTALAANTTAGTGRTFTADSRTFRQYLWSNDEPTVSGSSMDEWELFVPFAEVWNAGYGDTNVQAVVVRPGQAFAIKEQGTTAVGSSDLEIEFSNE